MNQRGTRPSPTQQQLRRWGLGAALFLALSACTDSGTQSAESSTPTEPPESAVVSSSASMSTTTPTSSVEGGPDGGIPGPGGQPSGSGARPVTELENEMAEMTAACAVDEGVVVEVDSGGVLYTPPPGEEDRYRTVVRACSEKTAEAYGIETGRVSPETMKDWYRAYVWTHECMIENDYYVSDPPSIDVYVESGGAAWHPYNAIMLGDGEEVAPGVAFTEETFTELENTCPQDLNYLLNVLQVLDK